MADHEAKLPAGRVSLAEAIDRLRRADELTDAGFTAGLRAALARFAELFDELWDSDPTFRERWRPRPTRLRQIFSGHYLDTAPARGWRSEAGIKISLQLSEHGGHWDFLGTTRYKPPKGGRSVKLYGERSRRRALTRCRACVGTHGESYSTR